MTPEMLAELKVDRAGWPSGPWDQEPDRVDFRHAGFACFMLRQAHGFWCGYVGVPSNHATYKQDYNRIDVEVHGGLTYSDVCDGKRLCPVAEPGEPDDLWWLGFDCWHGGDLAPGASYSIRDDEYRDAAYVRRECESLADQLAAMAVLA